MVVGCWLLVVGGWLLVVDCWWLVVGCCSCPIIPVNTVFGIVRDYISTIFDYLS